MGDHGDRDNQLAMQAYYARDGERDRLDVGVGRVEYARTVEVVGRTLPAAPATIADIGGGPGRYTDWLVAEGHTVIHRDLVEYHVDQVRSRHGDRVDTAVADARALDLDDGSVDEALLLGPLYHLEHRHDRVQALREALRIVRPGGHVYVAAITRWAARLDGMLVSRVHQQLPEVFDEVDAVVELDSVERTGWMRPLFEGSFTGYTHRPGELADEIGDAGLDLQTLVNVEGVSFALHDIEARMNDPDERTLVLDTLRAVEAVPELLGTGPHLLAVAVAR